MGKSAFGNCVNPWWSPRPRREIFRRWAHAQVADSLVGVPSTDVKTDAEKAFNKIQHLLMIKTLNNSQLSYFSGMEGTYVNIIRAIYDKSTANSFSTLKTWKHFIKDQEQDKDAHSCHFYWM